MYATIIDFTTREAAEDRLKPPSHDTSYRVAELPNGMWGLQAPVNFPSFYTLDAEYWTIEQDATILRAADEATLAAAADEINRRQSPGDFRISGWAFGQYSDCWVKYSEKPGVGEIEVEIEVEGVPCYVSPPGSHPGGRQWWVTPAVDVLVPVWEEIPVDE